MNHGRLRTALAAGSISVFAVSCGSSQIDTSEQRHDSIAARSGLYCEYVQQKGRMDEFEIEFNTQVAQHCGHGRAPSLTQYTVGEIRGIMFCCSREAEARNEQRTAPSPLPSPSPSPWLPFRRSPKPSPSPYPARSRALPPAQKPAITPSPTPTTPPPSLPRPDQQPATAPSP